MTRPRRVTFLPLALVLLLLCARCSPGPSLPAPQSPSASETKTAFVEAPASPEDARGPLPIYAEDTRWGSSEAPVTIVAFIDLECPYCARGWAVLDGLVQKYGSEKLRIVIKHYPLPFHRYARSAALSAIAVQQARGSVAALRFMAMVFEGQAELGDAKLVEWMRQVGVNPNPSLSIERQLVRDAALVRSAGVTGTPCFFVNGIRISGAQPPESFEGPIDAELAAVTKAREAGNPASHADRVAANYSKDAAGDAPAEPVEDLQVWKVPVGSSPTLGPADALVTIVEFADYQCPYCKVAHETLKQVRAKYSKDVRIVFKHNPLPFHERARPAAQLAIEAYRERGADGFWKSTDALFDAQNDLSEERLLSLAKELGLNVAKVQNALVKNVHDPVIEDDQGLAEDFEARGTPHFFINGRRLSGARPLEDFVALIDEQMEKAREIVAKGTPRAGVYARILSVAKEPPPPAVVDLAGVSNDRPSLGPPRAPVMIRIFSDFQCPFCDRVRPTLATLRAEFPKDVRFVFHNLPLPFHDRARAAANAAFEARAQRGNDGFWKMHDLLFDNRDDLSDERLAAHARALGLDTKALLDAVRSGRHDAILNEDAAVAKRAGIEGTPSFSVNGYFISGAQPLTTFRRAVRRALDDHRRGVRPKPNYAETAK